MKRKLRPGETSVTYYCECGLAVNAAVISEKAAPHLLPVLLAGHVGEGHGPTTAAKAREARERQSRLFRLSALSVKEGDNPK